MCYGRWFAGMMKEGFLSLQKKLEGLSLLQLKWVFLSVALIIFFIDVITKFLVRSKLAVGAEISICPFFSLTHVENTGVAFGMFQNQNMFFLVMGTVLSVVIIWMGIKTIKEKDFLSAFSFALVLGGAWGNLRDRLLLGRVTDFLDFYWREHHWPSFNVADSAICVGAGLLMLWSLKRSKVDL